jgi:hypothetical protein
MTDVSPIVDEAEFRLPDQVSESGQDVRWCTMGIYIGQTSQFQPAVVLDIYSENADGVFHMLFVSSDSSNRLLHTFSPGFGADEGTVWEPVPSDTGQTTHSAPALVIYRDFDGQAGITANFLVAVFIADDPSNRLLYSTLDLNKWAADQSTAWSPAQQVPGESAREIYACATTGEPGAPGATVYVYFLANDDTGRILVASFTLEQ